MMAISLISLIDRPAIHDLGCRFVLAPVLLNCFIILLVAVAFNHLFARRQYPIMRNRLLVQMNRLEAQDLLVSHKCIDQAVKEMDLIVDLTREDFSVCYQCRYNRLNRVI